MANVVLAASPGGDGVSREQESYLHRQESTGHLLGERPTKMKELSLLSGKTYKVKFITRMMSRPAHEPNSQIRHLQQQKLRFADHLLCVRHILHVLLNIRKNPMTISLILLASFKKDITDRGGGSKCGG